MGLLCTLFAFHLLPCTLAGFGSADLSSAPVATQAEQAAASRPASAGPLVCENPTYNFGTVWGGQVIRHEFEVTNVGPETLWVKALHVCSCTGPLLDKVYRMEPGAKVKIPVSLRTSPSLSTHIKKIVHLQIVPRPEDPQRIAN